MLSTTRVTNQLSGLVHKTNELQGNQKEYYKRFEQINIQQSEKYKQQQKIKDQLRKQVNGGATFFEEETRKFFYDNEYNLPNEVMEYVIKFLEVKDQNKKQVIQEWLKFYRNRHDFDKQCLEKLVSDLYDKRKQEQEKAPLHIQPIQWIDEVEHKAKQMYELKVNELDYIIDQNASLESLSELPLLTWEEEYKIQKQQHLHAMESFLDDKPEPEKSMQLNIPHKNYILEIDEGLDFQKELQEVGDEHKYAITQVNKKLNLQPQSNLQKNIRQLEELDSIDSKPSYVSQQSGSQADIKDFGFVISQLEKKQPQILEGKEPTQFKEDDIEDQENKMVYYLQKLNKRQLSINQVLQALNITEQELKQMYTLYQKAQHFDRMQAKMKKLIEEQERLKLEYEQKVKYYDNLNNKNLHGNEDYNQLGQQIVNYGYLEQPPHPQDFSIFNQIPLANQQQAMMNVLYNAGQTYQQQQYQNQNPYQMHQISQISTDEQQAYYEANQRLFVETMKDLQVQLQKFINFGRNKEAQIAQGKIIQLQQMYHSTTNMVILYYQLKQLNEEAQLIG